MGQTHSDGARPKPRRRVAERLPESKILRETLLALSRAGALVQRNNSGLLIGADGRRVRMGMKGAADILACFPIGIGGVKIGLFIAIECKSTRGTLSKNQRYYRAAARKAGALHFVVKSKEDISAMMAEIERAGRWVRGSSDLPPCLTPLVMP